MARFVMPLLQGGVALVLVLAAAFGAWWWGWGRYRLGDMRINPRAGLDQGKTYALRFWGVHWPPSPAGQAYGPWLRQALAEFQARYPNIRVEHRLLEPETAYQELAAALRAGNPPDVFAAPPGGPLLLSSSLQVPAGFYLDRRERRAYLAAAWDAVSARGQVWAWPQWLVARTWLGNRRALEAAGLDLIGAALRSDRTALAAALSRRAAGTTGLAVYPVGMGFFEDLMAAAGAPVPVNGGGRRLWPRDQVRAAADWAAALKAGGSLAVPGSGELDALVDDLFEGRLAAVGGANPWLTARLLRIDAQRRQGGPRLVQLPVPGPPGAPDGLTVSAGALAVFRQRSYQGHDHTRAAVELARFMSRLPHPWVAPDSPVMPAYGPVWARWMVASRPEHQWLFGRGLAGARPVPPRTPEQVQREQRFLAEEARRAVSRFWSGQATAGSLAERIGGSGLPAPETPWWRRWLRGGGSA